MESQTPAHEVTIARRDPAQPNALLSGECAPRLIKKKRGKQKGTKKEQKGGKSGPVSAKELRID